MCHVWKVGYGQSWTGSGAVRIIYGDCPVGLEPPSDAWLRPTVCAVWPRTLWKIPSESARTSWIIGERQKWCTVGIISGKSSKNRSLGAPGQIYCPDNHLSFRRESLAGVPARTRSQIPGPRSQISGPRTRSQVLDSSDEILRPWVVQDFSIWDNCRIFVCFIE